jgi:hypothetical protein
VQENCDLEVLLVLCCLVAVIVFLCFSLGAVNLGEQVGLGRQVEVSAAKDDSAYLAARQSELQRALAELTEQNERLLEELADMRKQSLADPSAPQPEQRSVQALAALEEKLRELRKRIEEVKAQLRTEDLDKLRKDRDDLDAKVQQKRDILAKIPIPWDPSGEQSLQTLRDQIKALDAEIAKLKKLLDDGKCPPDVFCMTQLTGPTTLKNPLIVECVKGELVIQPGGRERIRLEELDRRNPFSPPPQKRDGVYFLIRPDGYEVFKKAYYLAEEMARETKLKIMYTLVEANRKLVF